MGYWVSQEVNSKVDGTKIHIFDIPNGYVTARAGVAILRCSGWGGWVECGIQVNGMIVSRRASSGNWGSTVNAYVPAGVTLNIMTGGDGGLEYFKFMEF
ncbi:TPA: hypothetical protein H1V70_000121 [Salmonella enterica]|nr:hypothetical protein [Salmonella enterica]